MTAEPASRTIVAGYDGSPAALAAVERAIDRAGWGGRLVVVHAYQVPADYAGAAYYSVMLNDAAEFAAGVIDVLERDCERLASVEHECDICLGPAAHAIVRAAERHEADEIIVGSRGAGPIRALLGSVAHDVIHRARCPVTVIPARMTERQPSAPPAAVDTA